LHLRENAKHKRGYAINQHGQDISMRVKKPNNNVVSVPFLQNRYFEAAVTFNQSSLTLGFDKFCLSVNDMQFNSHEGPRVNTILSVE